MIAHIKSDGTKQTLEEHLVNSTKIAKHFGEKVGLSNVMTLTSLLHDLGKATDQFNEYLTKAFYDPTSVRRGEVNHSSAGGKFIFEKFYQGNQNKKLTAQLITYAIFAHHGIFDILTVDGDFIFNRRLNPEREIYYDEVLSKTKKFLLQFNLENVFERAVEEVTKIITKIKAIVEEMSSNKEDVVDNFYFLIGCLQRLILSMLIDSDHRETANFMENINIFNHIDDKHLWSNFENMVNQKIKNFAVNSEINRLRNKLSDECWKFGTQKPGIYCMHIPTGGGKTISGLRYALNHAKNYNKDRIIYVAPYLSILEQNADVYRELLEREEFILEHHSNIVIEDDKNLQAYRLFTQTWDQPIILTTMVQLLNTLFSGSIQSIRRMHQLSNSVIIIDEIQSLPIKTIHMFTTMMNFFSKICKTTVVLSSATQPLLGEIKRKIIYSHPKDIIREQDDYSSKFKRTNVIPMEKMNTDELVSFIINQSKNEDSILIILNTKQAVRDVYNALGECQFQLENVELMQLTTFMCPQHRSDVIDRLKDSLRKRKVICISTQLIEAGVDISFSCVIRSLAGLDRIAQAAGRCNRNGEKPHQGNVYVVNYIEENLSRLKEIRDEQEATERVLHLYSNNSKEFDDDLLSPKSLQTYYRFHFFNKMNEMDYWISMNRTNDHTLFDLLARNTKGMSSYIDMNECKVPTAMYCQAFRTAGEHFEVIDSQTIGILVPYKQGKQIISQIQKTEDIDELQKHLRNAQRFTVNIHYRSSIIRDLLQRRAVYTALNDTVYILHEDFYDELIGISTELQIDII